MRESRSVYTDSVSILGGVIFMLVLFLVLRLPMLGIGGNLAIAALSGSALSAFLSGSQKTAGGATIGIMTGGIGGSIVGMLIIAVDAISGGGFIQRYLTFGNAAIVNLVLIASLAIIGGISGLIGGLIGQAFSRRRSQG